jgi:hypothetical protein
MKLSEALKARSKKEKPPLFKCIQLPGEENVLMHDLICKLPTTLRSGFYSISNKVCPVSFLPWFSIYDLITLSVTPTVETKYPSDHIASVPQ